MNFLRNIFNNDNQTEDSPKIWNILDSEDQLTEIARTSYETPVAIFKHSTRCSISSMAKNRIERSWDIPGGKVEMYFLDLIANRHISNKIAEAFGVQHESPQIILIKKGEAVYHTSHNDISTEGIMENL